MQVPREIVDALESIVGIYFSDVRHRARAAFILADELVEMCCKLKAREINHRFDFSVTFNRAWSNPDLSIPAETLGSRIQASRNTRNNMQHASAAATVDDEHCAAAIMDAVEVVEHCWPDAAEYYKPWIACALRIVHLHSPSGDPVHRMEFEDEMRRTNWKADERPPTDSEVIIDASRRQYWQLLLTQSQSQVEEALASVGVP